MPHLVVAAFGAVEAAKAKAKADALAALAAHPARVKWAAVAARYEEAA